LVIENRSVVDFKMRLNPASGITESKANRMSNPNDKNRVENKPAPRDPEDRPVNNLRELKEKMEDKTIADSFPASDPPSSIPDPSAEDPFAA
jgi:hypothetical protein